MIGVISSKEDLEFVAIANKSEKYIGAKNVTEHDKEDTIVEKESQKVRPNNAVKNKIQEKIITEKMFLM
ncbi:unnamed protein product [Parnassius apollo]|uniref:(apollo) hypothetical protein n=1 Tax=Parnassius apollo TaxID=110799 RepID=A0A8S3WDP8_PARAO|nr:unnamed protein product [Parnassius apollo]